MLVNAVSCLKRNIGQAPLLKALRGTELQLDQKKGPPVD